ncbi:MAG: hypothetical protein LC808_13175 [Actinobacteria bacterium]|nr:hypothetical protein [Actinomycetota bacterium]
MMDIEMPAIGGIEATRRVAEARPNCLVLVLTMYGEDEFMFAARCGRARRAVS